jgi:hypothetical protein
MIVKETVDGKVFIAQTTYYIYRSEEDLQTDKQPMLITSDTVEFEGYKNRTKEDLLMLP